jgi:hypothetical protein
MLNGRIHQRRLRLAAAIVALGALACTASRAAAQSYVNFESGPVRPLALSPDHDQLRALNVRSRWTS